MADLLVLTLSALLTGFYIGGVLFHPPQGTPSTRKRRQSLTRILFAVLTACPLIWIFWCLALATYATVVLGQVYTLFREAQAAGRAVSPAILSGTLSGEEISHIAAICQQPESPQNARQALADYIHIIQTEANKRAGKGVTDPLLAATEKYKNKKGTGGKQYG